MVRALASVIFILINEFIKNDNKWTQVSDSIYNMAYNKHNFVNLNTFDEHLPSVLQF